VVADVEHGLDHVRQEPTESCRERAWTAWMKADNDPNRCPSFRPGYQGESTRRLFGACHFSRRLKDDKVSKWHITVKVHVIESMLLSTVARWAQLWAVMATSMRVVMLVSMLVIVISAR
jgi:hypothetical protein